MKQSDFFGITTGNKMNAKFNRSGLHAVKTSKVVAPVITEYPLTMECTVEKFEGKPYGLRIPGRIVNTQADESVQDDLGRADAGKLYAFAFEQSGNSYYAVDHHIGQA